MGELHSHQLYSFDKYRVGFLAEYRKCWLFVNVVGVAGLTCSEIVSTSVGEMLHGI